MKEADELWSVEIKEQVAFEAADLLYFILTQCIANCALPKELALPRHHPPEPQLLKECIEVDELMAEPVDHMNAESKGDSSDGSDLSMVKIIPPGGCVTPGSIEQLGALHQMYW